MTVSAEARELAGKTAAEIRRRSWVQGSMADTDGGDLDIADCAVCLVGGLAAVLTGDPRKGDDLLDGYLAKPAPLLELIDEFGLRAFDQTDAYLSQLVHWNDRHDRTEAEVLALLDSIAADQ